jgi:hypothetical protein
MILELIEHWDVLKFAHNETVADSPKLDIKAIVSAGLTKALNSQQSVAASNVARLRRVHPDKSPAELISYLNKAYLGAVTLTGAGAGAAAIVPNVVVQVPAAVADLLSFLEASVLYTLSVAEVHSVHLEDAEKRKLLVMAVLIGDTAAARVFDGLIEKTVPYWGKLIVDKIPMAAINTANKILGPRFITKYGTKQGTLVLAKQVPATIGVAIGAGGNHIFGWGTIRAAKRILGPAPEVWPLPVDDEPTAG